MMDSMIFRSVLLFVVSGLCEIGGGYLVWLWLRDGRAVWLGALGGLILFLYGVLPTFQPLEASFGRVYAAYGGVFVVLRSGDHHVRPARLARFTQRVTPSMRGVSSFPRTCAAER